MARWRIRPADPVEDGFIVTAPNGVEFESFQPLGVVKSTITALERADVFAEGCDPVLPPDWPVLVLVPVLHGPCRRCGERRPASEYSLKLNGQLSGTCDICCSTDSRRNSKARLCPICGLEKPDMRMKRGKIGCVPCLTARVEVATPKAFDVDAFCRESRNAAGLSQSNVPRSAARNDLARSVVYQCGKIGTG